MTIKPTSVVATVGSYVDVALVRVASLFADDHVIGSFTRTQRWLLCALVALAALARFWDVGSFGLHAPDEGTTTLPALHILQDGWPRFPSGMLYTRAVAHSYLIAGSVAAFGNTEWALRLPSVLCGTVLVLLAVLMGRRFLTPAWNLGFAAVVAFLPGLIADSQVVRMYIFLVASLTVYTHFIFRWESTGRISFLVAAVLAMIVGIQLHQLAIFGSLVIFMPAIAKGDSRLFWRACLAYLPIAAYFVYVRWTPSEYPLLITDFPVPDSQVGLAPVLPGLRFRPQWALPLLALGAAGAWLAARRGRWAPQSLVLATLLLLIAVCSAVLYYHVALLLLLVALVLAARQGRLTGIWTLVGLAVLALVACWQLYALIHVGHQSLRKALGVMVGQPSVWQYAAASSYSLPAAALVLLGAAYAAMRLARRQALPDVWLYFLLAVAVPLLLLGLTDWYFPPRYVKFALLPMILTALTVAQTFWFRIAPQRSPWKTGVAVLLASAVVFNPLAAGRAATAGASFVDHRGAARYVESQHPGPRDIIVAEDVLYPWYYLGHVDYWLMGRLVARNFAERVNGQVVYQYTHTPLIGTAAELQALIDRPDRGAIYIIGSGEDMADGRRFIRGDDIADLLASGRLPTVFVGRDGLTRVWRIPAADAATH